MSSARPEDEAARLYDAFGASLYRYAVMILADRDAAEDVVQQVFAAVVAGGPGRIDDPRHYLRRAVRNACYSVLRRRRLDRTPEPRSTDELLEEVPGPSEPVSGEVRLALTAAIRQLPAEQREVIHLHAFEGLTFREIAEATGDRLNTVASRYRYGLHKLRQALGDPARPGTR